MGEIDNIAAYLSTEAGKDVSAELSRLGRIEKALDDRKWLEEGRISAALGRAWGKAGNFDRAVEFYTKALRAEDGAMTLKDVEKLANPLLRRTGRLAQWKSPVLTRQGSLVQAQ